MAKTYYTYRIRVANRDRVQVEKWDAQHQDLGQPSGALRYQQKLPEIALLLQVAGNNELNDSSQARSLGEALFDVLFDDGLRQDFFSFYYQVVQEQEQLLRVELDIDEQGMPEIAALPWEFMCLPARSNWGTIWMGTLPSLVFARWRSQGIPAQPIQLEPNEKLRIALVISAPSDLPPVESKKVQEALEKLAVEQANRVELLPIVTSANPEAIDEILSKDPHLFHFIGHGRMKNEGGREVGEVALVDPEWDEAMWVEADYFSELFNQHRPIAVILQACEGGMLSSSQAFVGVASQVVQQNVPVVVAMQYEVTNSTASRFALRFYQQLAADEPVDIAAQSGRRSIALGPTQYRKRDFATPVIFMRVRDGYLFQRQKAETLQLPIQKPLTQLTGADGLGKLSNVPELPANFLPRPDDLEPLLALVLGTTEQAVAVTGKAQKVGVQGMGGIGKTMLATALARDEKVQRQFANGIVWVTLGQEPNLPARQAQVARSLTGEKYDLKDVQDGKAVLSELLADKACLLILDDVWQLDHAAAFNVLGARSQMLLTSRDRGLIESLGAREYQLDVLNDAQALQLLAQSSQQAEETLPSEALNVAQECGNLPLALAMVGAMAKGEPDLWSALLEALQNASLEEIEQEFPDYPYPNLLRAIKVSVDALEPEEKQCYLDLGVFAEDTPIPVAALQTFWEPKGVKPLKLKKIIKTLVNRSLVQRDKSDRLTLHDLQLDYTRKQCNSLPALHGRLVDAYQAKCTGGWATGPKDGYFFEHLGYHLVNAARQEELRSLLLQLGWLQAKLEATNTSALIVDFDRLPEDGEIRLVQGAIRLSANLLALDPKLLWSQLYGRLMSHKLPGIEAMLAQPPQAVWFRPLVPSLISAGGSLLRTLEGHSNWVSAVAIAPNGKQAVSASRDQTLKLWDLQAGTCLRILEGHSNWVSAVTIAPNGKLAVSASEDRTLKLWDLQAGTCLHTLEGHSDSVNAVAIALDGKLAVSASRDQTLKLWDLQAGTCLHTLEGHSDAVTAVAIAPDGKLAVSASYDRTLKLWDLQAGTCLHTLEGHSDRVSVVAIAPDGKLTVSASYDRTLKLWDLQAGTCFHALEGHSDSVTAVAISPNGKLAVSASYDRTLKLWDLQTGTCLHTLEGHRNSVTAVAISPNGEQAISASYDSTLKLWDLQAGTCLHALEGHSNSVTAVAISPDGKLAVSASYDKTLKLWDLQAGTCLYTLKGHNNSVTAVAISPNGKLAISASYDKTLKLWDLQAGKCLYALEGHSDSVRAVAIAPNGKLAISASYDKTLKLWDLQAGKCLHALEGHSNWVRAVAIAPNGKLAVSASYDRTLKLWDLQAGTCLHILEGHSNSVTAVAIAPNGKQAVSASRDNTLKLWDLQAGKCLHTLEGHSDSVSAVAISPNGKLAISASYDKTLKLWDLQAGKCLRTLEGHSDSVRAVAIAPNGKQAVSASWDRTLKLWDLQAGACLHALEGHSNSVTAVEIAPNGKQAVSASYDSTLKLWDLQAGTCLHALEGHSDSVIAVAIAPDGKQAVSASDDSTLKLWDLSSGKCSVTWVAEASLLCCAVSPSLNSLTAIAGESSGRVHILQLEGLK